jgi:hypothetical protein
LHFAFLLPAPGDGLWNLLPGPISVRATALGGGRDVVHPGFLVSSTSVMCDTNFSLRLHYSEDAGKERDAEAIPPEPA